MNEDALIAMLLMLGFKRSRWPSDDKYGIKVFRRGDGLEVWWHNGEVRFTTITLPGYNKGGAMATYANRDTYTCASFESAIKYAQLHYSEAKYVN